MTKRICLLVIAFIMVISAFSCAKPQSAGTPSNVASEETSITIQSEAAEITPETIDGLGIKILLEQDGAMSSNYVLVDSLWPESLGITADFASVAAYMEWYLFSNAAMGVCLTMANEMDGYILSDRETHLAFEANGGTVG